MSDSFPSKRPPVIESPLGYKIRRFTLKTLLWGRDHVPPGIRSLIGVLFCIGGVFGFLPVLGFWMLPLGLAFIALDIPGLRARLDHRIANLQRAVDAYEAQSNQ